MKSLVDSKKIDMRAALKKVYVFSGILYVASLVLRIVGPFFISNPSVVGEFNQPLAGTLRFVFNELTSLVSPAAASFCLVIAIIMHLVLSSNCNATEEED